MADQATLNNGPNARIHAPFTEGVMGNLAEFGRDTLELGELQTKLISHDLNDCVRRSTVFIVLAAIGALILIGLVPVALAGVGLLIAQTLQWSLWASLLITAGSALVVSGILALIALRGIQHSLESFERSREELTRNLAWLKTVLSSTSGRPTPPKQKQPSGWRFPS